MSPAAAGGTGRLVVLISGRGSNMEAIVSACADGSLNASTVAVISNNADAGGLAFASERGIPTCVVDHRDYHNRDEFDRALLEQVDVFAPDLVALAGFMRVLGEDFVKPLQGRLLNIHPSLLPQYPGLDTHARALADEMTVAGASVHFVTPQLDGGPVIVQAPVRIESNDTSATLAARVLQVEHRIFPLAIQSVLSGEVSLQQGQCYRHGRPQLEPQRWPLSETNRN